MTTEQFVAKVDRLVERDYDVTDGADIAFHLLNSGELRLTDDVQYAARLVAQRLIQQ